MTEHRIEVEGPFDNAYEALGLPESDVRQAKNLARRALREAIAAKGIGQREAAKLLGVPQPNLARALNISSSSLSWDQLFRFWTALGGCVQIKLVPASGSFPGHVEAEGPGMPLCERKKPPSAPPSPKQRRSAAERVRSTSANENRTASDQVPGGDCI